MRDAGVVHKDNLESRTRPLRELRGGGQGGEAVRRAVDSCHDGLDHGRLLSSRSLGSHNHLHHAASVTCMIQPMVTEGNTESRVGRLMVNQGDGLDLIETELAVLTRTLEGMHRRSELYRELDRASYLMARTLDTTGPVSINRLASILGLDATTVTRQVATMEATKLVVRRSDPSDGRISLISLSPKGRRTMRAVQLARKERIASLLDDWTEDDRRQLGRLLARFNDDVSHDSVR